MQDILSLINSRYTCKDYDPNKKISDEDFKIVKEILIKTPTSSNTQSNRFIITSSDEVKQKIADCSWETNYNLVLNASHVIVFCGVNGYDKEYLHNVFLHEDAVGRFDNFTQGEEYFKKNRTTLHMALSYKEQINLIDDQANIALGFFLLGIEGLGINATPMGGFSRGDLDQALGLKEKGLHSVYVVTIGYSGNDDYNAPLNKGRLPEKDVIIEM